MKNVEQHAFKVLRVLTGNFLDGKSIEREKKVCVGHGIDIVFSFVEKNKFTLKVNMSVLDKGYESFSMKIIVYPFPLCFARAVTFEQFGIVKQDAMQNARLDIDVFHRINETLLNFLDGCDVSMTGVLA